MRNHDLIEYLFMVIERGAPVDPEEAQGVLL